ncbi:MAG: hypothetical protein AAB288_11500, partial [Acidobacteriota bacterium]
IRMLWIRRCDALTEDNHVLLSWLNDLPSKVREFRVDHRWLGSISINGTISARGIDAIAMLLVSLRQKQRQLEVRQG